MRSLIVPIANDYPAENVWFEVANVMDPLRWSDGSISLVHMRDAILGVRGRSCLSPMILLSFSALQISNYQRLLNEVARVLRPNGLFVSCEWTRQLGTHDGSDPTLIAPRASAFLRTLNDYLSSRHGNVLTDPALIPQLIASSGRFDEVTCFQYVVPLDNFDGNTNPRITAMRNNFRRAVLDFGGAIQGFVMDCGASLVDATQYVSEFRHDIANGQGLTISYNIVHARRS